MGYTVKWEAPQSLANILTTELNSLASATLSAAGAELDNSTGLYLFADFVLSVTYGTNPTAGGYVALYLTEALDGSTHSDVERELTSQLVGSFPLRATTSAQKIVLRGVQLPPFKIKPYVDNQAGQAMAASGNTLAWARYNVQAA